MTETSEIWTGEASQYDRSRPSPPPTLLDVLTQLIHKPRPALVVDLGSGTGLSTAIWSDRAQRVVGIEPNADMRTQAIRKATANPSSTHLEYRDGVANRTALPDACADIVTCAQSFHWMEPTSTLAEIARILRPGGVFAAYDYDWPPAFNWELEQVYQEVDERFDTLMQERDLGETLPRWSKSSHLERMRASNHFRFTREFYLHHVEQGNAARFIDMVLTNAYSHQFKLKTITEEEIGFERLREAALQHIGVEPIPWYIGYKVRIGIK
jgi:ubiquinone/menaquinone biosynthesis C-methylase UbiE